MRIRLGLVCLFCGWLPVVDLLPVTFKLNLYICFHLDALVLLPFFVVVAVSGNDRRCHLAMDMDMQDDALAYALEALASGVMGCYRFKTMIYL